MSGRWMSPGPWRQGDPSWRSDWRELAGRVYVGIREGNLSQEAAFDLASFLMDWAQPSPLIGELAEESVEGTDSERLADLASRALASRALDLAEFEPDFEREPRLLMTLEQYLAVAAADLRATGLDGKVELVVVGLANGHIRPRRFIPILAPFGIYTRQGDATHEWVVQCQQRGTY